MAGGLNLYGYVNGDPVNFSDPFGLCPGCAVKEVAEGYVTARLTGDEYGFGDAFFDAGIGLIGLGLAGDLIGFGKGVWKRFRAARKARATSLPRVRSGSAATKFDPEHAFPDIIDNYADDAASFTIPVRGPGGTVVGEAELRQIGESLNGEDGVFEWIIQAGEVTHRRFKRGASVDGIPNE